ncbi:MAG: SDR family oxidoreductase [Dehalococcoidia bacterium]
MRILVMGGSRFIGLHTVRELVRHGHEVTTFNRGVTPVDLPPGVRRLYGDRHEHEAMAETFRGEQFDAVVDCSAYFLADVESMVEIFGGKIGHYIFMSTPATYAPPKSLPLMESNPLKEPDEWPEADYGRHKAICERYLLAQFREHRFPFSSIRLPIIMGAHNTAKQREQLMFHRMLQGRPILIPGDGSTVMHGNYIPDMAQGVRRMLLNPRTFGEAYNAAMQEYYSDESWVDAVAEVVGVTPEKVFMPHDLTTEAYQTWGYQPVQRTQAGRLPWYRSVVFDTRKLHDHIGFRQEHTLLGALGETFEWFTSDEGPAKTFEWDFAHEDAMLERLRGK